MRFEEAKALLSAFGREGVRYVLIGSMAMAAHNIRRATQDIDFFVAPAEENVNRLKRALKSVFGDEAIDEISTNDLLDYSVIRYGPPGTDYRIDLIARLGEAFGFDDIESQVIDVEGITVHVATPNMLYRMKRDTARLQDRADAEAIRERFPQED